MLASSANQEGQANHARKLYGIPYESEFNAAGISRHCNIGATARGLFRPQSLLRARKDPGAFPWGATAAAGMKESFLESCWAEGRFPRFTKSFDEFVAVKIFERRLSLDEALGQIEVLQLSETFHIDLSQLPLTGIDQGGVIVEG